MKVRKQVLLWIGVAAVLVAGSASAQGQNPPPAKRPGNESAATKLPAATAAAITKRVEQFLRNQYAWGSAFSVEAGPVTVAPASDLYEVPVKVTVEGQSDTAIVYVSKDGRYMFRGELQDLNNDPLVEIRSELKPDGFASKGPADAKVTVVEFADFQCPVCRQLEYVLRSVLPQYPQVRFVFMDFPLEQMHPWAMTAAIAGHCALQQSQDAFWKFHDSIYDSQNLISVENASSKLTDLASKAGVDLAAYQGCMADPESAEVIRKSLNKGRALNVMGTPTVFVNGRRFVGPDQALLEQFLQFDLEPGTPKP